ncbi:MAG: Hsp20/alpha crystallin family protein [Anaerovoracaceae bacterium]
MFYPSIFRNSFFDDDDFMMSADSEGGLMKCDVRELDDAFVVEMDLPGLKKEDVKMQLKDGVLSIEATTNRSTEDKDSEGRYIRKERFQGTCKRSFYVGKDLQTEDIKAKFDNGVLEVTVPKKAAKPVEDNKYIEIEG